MNLYEITKEIANFEFEIDETTGEITNYDDLDAIIMARDEKVENIGLLIKNLDAEAFAIREEEKILANRRRAKEKKIEWLKKYLQDVLDGEKFETSKLRISYRKSQKVECYDFTKVPEEFLKMKEPELDKTAVKNAIKQGRTIDGCELVQSESMVIQ